MDTPLVAGEQNLHGGFRSSRTNRRLTLCATLDINRTPFPGGRIGFAEDPDAFATRLREGAEMTDRTDGPAQGTARRRARCGARDVGARRLQPLRYRTGLAARP